MAEVDAVPELRAYCANLNERKDRWRQVQREFAGSGIKLRRFPAIKKSVGWKGCGRTFQAIVRAAKRDGLPWVLIVEDDCDLRPAFFDTWPRVLSALWVERGTWDIYVSGVTNLRGIHPRLRSPLIRIDHAYSLQFHVVSADAYDKVLAWNPERDRQIDVYYAKVMRKVTSYPSVAWQKPSLSNIENIRKDYTRSFRKSERKLAAAIRATRKRRRAHH